ncbi:MAG: electron transfer flavoprotein subunit alpha/FixB family protein [Aeropyrum sp.]|nr:electron transfer flavoprotein subunit alpha/FixB family protein [Aeropyrum sp.]MCE4615969.1 electron transfer flavoprotein subunit alpha/FixB family protein [Aeropyrum sp.]
MKVLAVAYEEKDIPELIVGTRKFVGDSANIVLLAVHKSASSGDFNINVDKVYLAETSRPEEIVAAIVKLVNEEGVSLIVGEAYKNLRDAFSRVAGQLSMPLITDATEIKLGDDRLVVKRGFLSEKAEMIAEVPLPAAVLFLPRFVKAEGVEGGQPVVTRLEELGGDSKVRLVDVKPKEVGGANLEEAEIIVGVGRGFKSREDLEMAFELAKLLNGQVGCTRPIAADLKWLSEDHWIGISGKRVSPKIYFAIGISGSPQHMSGVQSSKIIVAINKDKSAPIFKQADYGVVADLYQFLPVFIKKLKERLG